MRRRARGADAGGAQQPHSLLLPLRPAFAEAMLGGTILALGSQQIFLTNGVEVFVVSKDQGKLFSGTCFYNGLFSSCVVYAHIYVSIPPLNVSIILEKADNGGRFYESQKLFAKHFRSVRTKNVGDKIMGQPQMNPPSQEFHFCSLLQS